MIGPLPDDPGPYQATDWHVVDYQHHTLPGSQFQWRGPVPPSLEPGTYFTAIGAAQTLGRFCLRPFVTQVAEAIDLPALNLGHPGAGPSFYLANPEVVAYVNRSAFVIVQVMSGRSTGNSMMECDSGRNMCNWLPTGERCFTEQAYRYLLADYDEKTVRRIIAETRKNWLDQMTQLLRSIEVPTVLLWISRREPDYRETLNGQLYDVLGQFPHLINDKMMRRLRRRADRYVESVSARGLPHQLVHRETGLPTTVEYPNGEQRGEDSSYPSPEMHDDAAAALIPVVEQLVPGADGRIVRPGRGRLSAALRNRL